MSRPLIKILEDLAIPFSTFLHLQRDVVKDVEQSKTSLSGSAKLLDRLSLGANSNVARTFRAIAKLLKIDVVGRNGLEDSLISAIVNLAVVESFREIKFKARIPLPGSWTLVGIADEDSYLEEGEIYACVQERGKERVYLSGEVAISRSPWIHPGDVRVRIISSKIPPEALLKEIPASRS